MPSRQKDWGKIFNRQKHPAKNIASADIKKDDIILEVGPGTGILTAELAQRPKK
jgi:16S rRNA A1518/A1519 N6-dimethyltransferase RsmA/KsgA/DIM1 with predicted DNA glycosylase/AP lyase activity